MTEGLSSDDLGKIVAEVQAASLDDSRWAAWTETMISHSRGRGGLFGVVNQRLGQIVRSHPVTDSAKGWEEYVGGMMAFDPQLLHCGARSGSTVYTDIEHVDLTDPVTRDYMKWQEDRFDFCTHIALTAQIDSAHMAVFSLHFPREHGERAQQLKAAYRTILPHFANAMKLGFAMSDLLTQAYWDGAQSMIDSQAAFLLSEEGRVLQANAAAEQLISQNALAYRQGRLACHHPQSNEKLQSLIGRALSFPFPVGGLARLERGGEMSPLFAEIFPVDRPRRVMAISEAGALLIVKSRSDALAPKLDELVAAFDLTLAEARVAAHLVSGRTDEIIAVNLGLAVSTVRSHVKAVLAKTHTRSKAEAAHLLTHIFHQYPQY